MLGMHRVAIVTADEVHMVTADGELPFVISALENAGVRAATQQWQDASVVWSAYDLVVIKSPWDYTFFADKFQDWLTRTSAQVQVLNCAHTIGWNLDKRYLGQLAELGVPVVPTRYVSGVADVAAAFDELNDQVVVKPNVSAGARDTGRFDHGDPAAVELARRIIKAGKIAMIQPAIESVATVGEHALLYFDGEYSHAIVKGPILDLGGGLVSGSYRETITSHEPTADEYQVAEKVLRVLPQILLDRGCDCPTQTPLYARLDLVNSTEGPLLLEAELFEPSLFFEADHSALVRYTQAICTRLGDSASLNRR